MALKKVSAIVDEMRLNFIEDALIQSGVRGYTIHEVRGRGLHNDAYQQRELVNHTQVDVYTSEEQAEKIAELIMDTASQGGESEGLVAILPVDGLYWMYGQKKATEEDFAFNEWGDDA